MLLPVLGENIQKLLNLQEQDFYKEIMEQKKKCERLEVICDDLMGFRQRLEAVICEGRRNEVVDKELWEYLNVEKIYDDSKQIDVVSGRNFANYYWQEMIQYIKEEVVKYQGKKQVETADVKTEKDGNDELANLLKKWSEMEPDEVKKESREAFQCECIRCFFENRGSKLQVQETIENGKRKDIWEWFQEAIHVIGKYRNSNLHEQVLSHSKVSEFKKSLWGNKTDGDVEIIQKNMINYVMKHTPDKLSEKQIRNCYERLMNDMLECVLEIEAEEKKKNANIDSLF